MKNSRVSVENHNTDNITKFGALEVGDVFRIVHERCLYMMVQMPPGTLVLKQGVRLSNGERRAFNEHTPVVQVKSILTWEDME